MASITQSVGENAVNREADVRTVQSLLNRRLPALGMATLVVDGRAGAPTIAAIRRFQQRVVQLSSPDGRIDPGGRTWRALDGTPAPASADLSGAAWWHANQARFPNSAAIADLEPAFAGRVNAFLAALRTAGATVEVSATRRNRIRAYLMHYSWRLARGGVEPAAAPAEPGCRIVWDHGDGARSRRAAQEMVDLFRVVFLPSLRSRHIEGRAIDMTIRWSRAIVVADAAGGTVTVPGPGDGGSSTVLHAIGAGYGVRKLVTDPPHWSDDGH